MPRKHTDEYPYSKPGGNVMYIGKIARMLVLMISIFAASTFVMPSVSSAEDVWCYSNDIMSFYLDSDSVGETKNAPEGISYGASGKLVSNEDGSFVNIVIYGFAVPNDNVEGYSYWRAKGKWEYIGSIKKNSELRAVWEAMKPYMKKKGIYYSDYWE